MAMTFFGELSRPGLGGGRPRRGRARSPKRRPARRGARRAASRPIRTPTAQAAATGSRGRRTGRPSRTTLTTRTIDDAPARARARAVARTARVADADDVPADGAGRRRRSSPVSSGFRAALGGPQRDRALPRAELHGGASRGDHEREAAAAAARPEPADGEAASTSRRKRTRPAATELGLMGVLGADRGHRHPCSRTGSTSRVRRSPERLRPVLAGVHRLLSHKHYVDELYNATVDRRAPSSAARKLWTFDRRVRRRRRQRRRLADDCRRLVLGPDRSHRRRRRGEPGRPHLRGRQLLVPQAADRPGAELRAADAVRDLRFVTVYLFLR